MLWTLGLLVAVSVLGVLFLAHNPRPHRMVLEWFITVPAGASAAIGVGCMIAGARQIRRSLAAMDGVGARRGRCTRGVESTSAARVMQRGVRADERSAGRVEFAKG